MPAVTRFTRDQLYARVWAEPIDRQARELGISNVGLGKLCRRHQIPVPGRGYWARRAAGQRVTRTPLPKLADHKHTTIITIHGTRMPATDDATSKAQHPFMARESLAEFAITVPSTLSLTDPLVAQTADRLRATEREASGLVPVPKGALHLHCSPEQRDRGLRIWQALLSAFTARGYAVSVKEGTCVMVLDESIGLALHEGTRTVPHVPTEAEQRRAMRSGQWTIPTHDVVPDGTLRLMVTNVSSTRQRWRDGKVPVEQQLNAFLKGLVRAALTVKQQREEKEQRARAHQEEERRRLATERRWRAEKFRIAQLDALLAGWERAEALGRVLAAYKAAIGPASSEGELATWLSQMEERVAHIHPVRRLQPERIISLAHASYAADRILADGFTEPPSSSWSHGDTPPGILLDTHCDRTSGVVLVTILERLVLPYELIEAGSERRRFYVPPEILNQHATVTPLK